MGDESDGLYSNQFNSGTFFSTQSGKMLFGGRMGLVSFNTNHIVKTRNNNQHKVVVTSISINDKDLQKVLNSEQYNNVATEFVKKLDLKYNQNNLKFHFTALTYVAPNHNIFRYQLINFDKNWQYTNSSNPIAVYNNLKPGNYTLQLNGSNSDGVFSDVPVQIKIHVHPPFWNTALFKILLTIAFTALVFLIVWYRTARIRKKNLELDKLVKERTREILDKNEMLNQQAIDLSKSNQLLVERQNYIEEQSEELEQVAEKLKEQRDKLQETVGTKDKLLSIIAHDLKNPLNVIQGLAKLLNTKLENYSREKSSQMTGAIYSSAVNVNQLLENLLNWSRAQTGQFKIKYTNISLYNLVMEIFDLFDQSAQSKSINLVNNVSPGFTINADENMIKTVIRNLVSNAIKYTNEGTVIIDSEIVYGEIEITIWDTGVGMDKNKVSMLFSMDYTKSSPGTSGEKGTGLGLIICKEFVKYHKGSIQAESELGKGSTFRVTLPIVN